MQDLREIEQQAIADYVCLSAQFIITILALYNLRSNWNKFPIKQLSPASTLAALICYFVINLIAVAGRLIEKQNSYFKFDYEPYQGSCGQCRIKDHSEMVLISLIYSSLRFFPQMIFVLKTMRVCICFIYKKSPQIPHFYRKLFSRELYIIIIASLYSLIIFAVSIVEYFTIDFFKKNEGHILFEYLCPKQEDIFDYILIVTSFGLLMITYGYSLKAYRQLDFKKFLLAVFILNYCQVIIRVVFLWVNQNLMEKTYHEFYYNSLLIHLGGSLLLFIYSNFSQSVAQPPGTGILQNFDAFFNYTPGRQILFQFAKYQDQGQNIQQNYYCLQSYEKFEEIRKETFLNPQSIKNYFVKIDEVIRSQKLINFRFPNSTEISTKIQNKTLRFDHLRGIQSQLKQYCEGKIFKNWKKTESKSYFQQQFQENTIINSHMRRLNISI